jgi:hypothetical protein
MHFRLCEIQKKKKKVVLANHIPEIDIKYFDSLNERKILHPSPPKPVITQADKPINTPTAQTLQGGTGRHPPF